MGWQNGSVQGNKRLQLKSLDSQKMVKPKNALRMPAEDIGKPATRLRLPLENEALT